MKYGALWMTAALALLAASLTGCNTTAGIGKDVKAAGEAIQDGAESVKEKISD